MRTSWFEASNFVIGPTPDCPATSAFQLVGASLPNAVTIPRPVTTTRLLIIALPITKAVHATCMSLASAPRPQGAPHHYTPPIPLSRTRERRGQPAPGARTARAPQRQTTLADNSAACSSRKLV